MPNYAPGSTIRTKQWLVLGASSFQCMRTGFLCPKCDNFAGLHTRQDQNKLHLTRWFFLSKRASSVSRLQAHLLKRKRIEWSIGFNSWTNWTLYDVIPKSSSFVSMMSPKCLIVENDGELMLMALHTHFLPQQQYSRLHTLFLIFHALVNRWGCQFLSLFLQDNEHKELTVLFFF